MKPKTIKSIKKYLFSVIVLLVCLSVIAHAHVFVYPVRTIAKIFSLPAASIIIPYSKTYEYKEQKTENTQQKTEKTTEKTTAENSETKLANAVETGGAVITETIDKSGATASFGDVYIKNKTTVNVDFEKEFKNKPNLKIKLNSKNPQVLIVHTHATECFFPRLVSYYPKSWGERDQDTSKNMVAVGKVIVEKLNKSGIKTVQSQTLHDKDEYEGSYDRSRETIKKYLKKYPSIKVVLDVHRDAINEEDGDKIRPIVSINKKQAGQIMLISGCETGSITGYPNWRKNLRFSLRLQQLLEKTYPSLARPLFFAEKKYNQDLCENSVLVEVGSQANLIGEAKYSAELFSNVLIKYLKQNT
ncbi:MAG: stage II sporulation protein P [Clostridia bacterium]|nr:stage II sporulation protein P [Clostridia bacterium]